MVDWLRKEYESVFEDSSGKMQVSQGKVHTYLGMKLDYTVKGQVKISMVDYVDECNEDVPAWHQSRLLAGWRHTYELYII